jgi:hypothetical protein
MPTADSTVACTSPTVTGSAASFVRSGSLALSRVRCVREKPERGGPTALDSRHDVSQP